MECLIRDKKPEGRTGKGPMRKHKKQLYLEDKYILVIWVNNNGIVQEKEILFSKILIYPVWSRVGTNNILYYPWK